MEGKGKKKKSSGVLLSANKRRKGPEYPLKIRRQRGRKEGGKEEEDAFGRDFSIFIRTGPV